MIKLIYLTMSFLNIFNYQVITFEDKQYEEIYYQDEYYQIYLETNNIYLKTLNDEWTRELDLGFTEAILIDKNLFVFFYENNKLYCKEYNLAGKVIKEKTIFENEVNNLKIKYNNNFYIIGSVINKNDQIFKKVNKEYLELMDGFIIEFSKDLDFKNINLFGGSLNESIIDLSFTNDAIYIVGKKDVASGGDFGNGGKSNNTIFIAMLSYDLDLLKYKIINDNSLMINLINDDEYLFLISEEAIYKFNLDLEIINSNKLYNKAIYGTIAFFKKIIIFSKDEVIVYDFVNLKKIETINHNIDFYEIINLNNILYARGETNYYLDLAYLGNILYLEKINYKFPSQLMVDTLFGEAIFQADVSDNYFDSLVYGRYERKLKFINKFNLEFVVNKISIVEMEANVSEGCIYPVGYNLDFTGKGFLNENPIANNYSINSPGIYNLKLVGCGGEEHEINFIVDARQIKFSETNVINYNNVTKVNEIYYLKIKYEDELPELTSVLVDNKEYSDIIINKNEKTINIKMQAGQNPGLIYHNVNGIYYMEEEVIRYISLDLIYVVNILKSSMLIDIDKKEDFLYNYLIDDDSTARYFMISYYYNNEEYIAKYSLNSHKIVISDLPLGEVVDLKLSLCYDLGNKSFQKIDLLEVKWKGISTKEVFEIEILNKDNNLKQFEVKVLDSKKVERINVNQELTYLNESKNYTLQLVVGIVLAISSFIIIQLIKYLKLKKRMKYF